MSTLTHHQIKLAVAKTLRESGTKSTAQERRKIVSKVMLRAMNRHFGFENVPEFTGTDTELLAALNQ